MTLQKILKKWKDRRKEIINPDGFGWSDLGYEEKPEEYNTVEECLESEGEFDEERQTELRIISEIIEDLESIDMKS
jgi:hypothetical protein